MANGKDDAAAALKMMLGWNWLQCDPDGVPFHPGKELSEVVNELAMEGLRRPHGAVLTLLCQGELIARGAFRWRKYHDFEHFHADSELDIIKPRHLQTLARLIEGQRTSAGSDDYFETIVQLEQLDLKDCLIYEWEYGANRFSTAICSDELDTFDPDYMEEWYSAWGIEIWPNNLEPVACDAEPDPEHAVPAASKGGAPRKWDWDGALLHLAALSHHGADGLLRDDGSDPNQSDIARHLQAWFIDTFKKSPEDSQLRKYGKRFVTELNALKLRDANNSKASG